MRHTMPPRISLLTIQAVPRSTVTISSFLVPFIHQQNRSASILSSLSDNPGAYNKKIRLGRGPSSGKGKTSGRGQKGQKARGKVPKQFNGGQTPEDIVHGKLGFTNVHAVNLQEVNLDKIQDWIDQKRLDPSKPITLKELHKSGVVNLLADIDGVKLLGRDASKLKTPIHIVVSRASQSAIQAVEAVGGSVTTRFYTPKAVREIKRGNMHPYISLRWDPAAVGHTPLLPKEGRGMTLEERVTGLGFQFRLPDPISRKELEYYRDVKNRGYLSHLVGEGEGPSLFWKPPISEEDLAKLKRKSASAMSSKGKEENKLW